MTISNEITKSHACIDYFTLLTHRITW
uniref:Uncharacterized protein n=1 Tax=Arundo donax TaxID=35708 RepID=A0A0A8Y6I8_ARUDO